jgi:uncharacterized membrane protein YgdD (TMEM256/DUF423 family)
MTNHTLQKQMIQSGAILAGTAVALGALSTHYLKAYVTEVSVATFQTAARYQFYHALAILIVGGMLRRIHEKYARQIFQLFIGGIIIFSGSLYIIATKDLTFRDKINWVGGLTPFGGLALIGGWLVLGLKGYKFVDSAAESNHRHHRSSSSRTSVKEKEEETTG